MSEQPGEEKEVKAFTDLLFHRIREIKEDLQTTLTSQEYLEALAGKLMQLDVFQGFLTRLVEEALDRRQEAAQEPVEAMEEHKPKILGYKARLTQGETPEGVDVVVLYLNGHVMVCQYPTMDPVAIHPMMEKAIFEAIETEGLSEGRYWCALAAISDRPLDETSVVDAVEEFPNQGSLDYVVAKGEFSMYPTAKSEWELTPEREALMPQIPEAHWDSPLPGYPLNFEALGEDSLGHGFMSGVSYILRAHTQHPMFHEVEALRDFTGVLPRVMVSGLIFYNEALRLHLLVSLGAGRMQDQTHLHETLPVFDFSDAPDTEDDEAEIQEHAFSFFLDDLILLPLEDTADYGLQASSWRDLQEASKYTRVRLTFGARAKYFKRSTLFKLSEIPDTACFHLMDAKTSRVITEDDPTYDQYSPLLTAANRLLQGFLFHGYTPILTRTRV